MEMMQSGQRDMVIKLNELNFENFTKIMSLKQENLNKMVTVMRNGC